MVSALHRVMRFILLSISGFVFRATRTFDDLAWRCSAPGVPWLFRGVPWPCSVVFRGVCRGVPGVFRGCAVVVKKNYPPLGGCVGIFLGGSAVRLFFGPARSSFPPKKNLTFFILPAS